MTGRNFRIDKLNLDIFDTNIANLPDLEFENFDQRQAINLWEYNIIGSSSFSVADDTKNLMHSRGNHGGFNFFVEDLGA